MHSKKSVSRQVLAIITGAALTLFATACVPTKDKQTACPTPVPNNAILLLGATQAMTKGWSHIVKPEKAADFTGLKHPLKHYALGPKLFKTLLKKDGHCQNEQTLQTILVKKLHVWNNNHSNGIETHIPDVPVAQWKEIKLKLRIDSHKSHIPSVTQIQNTFPELHPNTSALDDGKATLYIVFRNGEQEAGLLLNFDPNKDFDRWLDITIPAEHLNYSKKVDYTHTPAV